MCPALGFFLTAPLPGFSQTLDMGGWGWRWAGTGSPLMINLGHSRLSPGGGRAGISPVLSALQKGCLGRGENWTRDWGPGGGMDPPLLGEGPVLYHKGGKATKEKLVEMGQALISRKGP